MKRLGLILAAVIGCAPGAMAQSNYAGNPTPSFTQPDGTTTNATTIFCATGVDKKAVPCGTSTNPIVVTGGTGGGGGGGDASAANQQAEIASLGTDGSSPPTIAGTGIRGWLRAIYERLTGTLAISATSLPLPAGAATASNQGAANTSLASIDTKTPALVNGRQPVDGSGVTQPVSAASLPLPTGAATAAAQATGNASIASVDGKLPALTNGRVPVDTGNTPAAQTTSGAVQPPTSAAGKKVRFSVSLAANTSTQLRPANDQRISYAIQCASGNVSIDETGTALTAAGVGNGTTWLPTAGTRFSPEVASLTAITAYSPTAQICAGSEDLR